MLQNLSSVSFFENEWMTLKVLGDTLMDELEVGLLLDCSVALSPAMSNIRYPSSNVIELKWTPKCFFITTVCCLRPKSAGFSNTFIVLILLTSIIFSKSHFSMAADSAVKSLVEKIYDL